MQNYGITLARGNYKTSGQQKAFYNIPKNSRIWRISAVLYNNSLSKALSNNFKKLKNLFLERGSAQNYQAKQAITRR